MSEKAFISQLTQRIRQFIASPDSTLIDEQLINEAQSAEMQELCMALNDLTTQQQISYEAIAQISAGNLDLTLPTGNKSLEPVKMLQAKLKHLLWQTQRIAVGDYNQRVDYLGAFSDSFSILTHSLQERKQMKEALMESYRKYDLIANNCKDVIWTLDISTLKFTYISPSIIQLRGLTVEEAMNEPIDKALTPDSLQRVSNGLKKVLEKMEETNTHFWSTNEYQQPCKDGRIIDVEISTSFIYDECGKPKEVLGISRDITARKRTERELLASEAKFKLIAENTQDVIWKIDLATFQYNYISPAVYRLRGYTVDEAMKQSVEESLTPEYAARAIATVQDYLGRPDLENLFICDEYQQPCKDGSVIDIELTASFLLDENGIPIEILGVTRDITERKKNELALKESQAQLSQLLSRQTIKNKTLTQQLQYFFDNTINAIAFFEINKDDIFITHCNNRWASSINRSIEELRNVNIKTVLDPHTLRLYRQYLLKAAEIGEPTQEYCIWRNYHLDVVVIPIKETGVTPIQKCAVFALNITDIIAAEQKVKLTEQKFFNIFNNSSDAIVVLTPNLDILEVNKRFYQLTGFAETPKPFKIENLDRYIDTKYHDEIKERLLKVKILNYSTILECELRLANGNLVPVELNCTIYNEEGQTMILALIRDVSARKNYERQLANVAVQIETRERRVLAADLHDNVGPLLSSMNMYLSSLARKQDMIHLPMIGDIQSILKETITSVREISNNISPHVLSNYGLTSALEVFFETKLKLIHIEINNNIGNLRFDEIKEVMCYNIIKELFNNTLKYAKATTVSLSLTQNDDLIRIQYSDNGVGFDVEQKLASPSNNLGLLSIINRVKTLHGTIRMTSQEQTGFHLDIEFPLSK